MSGRAKTCGIERTNPLRDFFSKKQDIFSKCLIWSLCFQGRKKRRERREKEREGEREKEREEREKERARRDIAIWAHTRSTVNNSNLFYNAQLP